MFDLKIRVFIVVFRIIVYNIRDTAKKLRRAIDDYHHFSPGTTKKIKSKHIEEPAEDMDAVDDNSTRFHVGTPVFKVFGKVEH